MIALAAANLAVLVCLFIVAAYAEKSRCPKDRYDQVASVVLLVHLLLTSALSVYVLGIAYAP